MGTNPIHRLRVNLMGEPGGIPDRMNDIEALLLYLFDQPMPSGSNQMAPLFKPRDTETDIDKLQAEAGDLFRQLRGIRDRLNKVESQPLDVADQLTTLDQRMTDMDALLRLGANEHGAIEQVSERIDNIEKHCQALEARQKTNAGRMDELIVNCAEAMEDWRRMLDGVAPIKGRLQPSDYHGWRPEPPRPIDAEQLFRMGTDQCGVVCLERWREGLVLWYHGSIVWRSWKESGHNR